MTTEAIEILCEKLGTTIENLVPTVISYGLHDCVINMWVSGAIMLAGLIMIIIGIICVTRYYGDGYLIFFGSGIMLIGVVWFGLALYSWHMWNAYPTIRAYRTILGWISNG